MLEEEESKDVSSQTAQVHGPQYKVKCIQLKDLRGSKKTTNTILATMSFAHIIIYDTFR